MERESRGEKFVSRKRLNIVARSVAAVSIAAAGAAVAEKSGLFDPLTNPVESANHLVLNNLDKSYEQLIDKLPEVDKAEAAPPDATSMNPSTNPAITDGNCNPEQIDFTPHSATMHVGDHLTFTVDACLKQDFGIFVRLVEADGASDDNLDDISVSSYDGANGRSVAMTFHLDCVDGDINSSWFNKLVGAGGALHSSNAFSADYNNSAQLAIEMDYDVYSGTNYTDNIGAEMGAAQIKCLNVGCPGGVGSGAEGAVSGYTCSNSVGGTMKVPNVEALPQDINSEKNPDYTTPIAAGIAAAVAGTLTSAASVLYIRRKRSTQ